MPGTQSATPELHQLLLLLGVELMQSGAGRGASEGPGGHGCDPCSCGASTWRARALAIVGVGCSKEFGSTPSAGWVADSPASGGLLVGAPAPDPRGQVDGGGPRLWTRRGPVALQRREPLGHLWVLRTG